MPTSLPAATTDALLAGLAKPNRRAERRRPGEQAERQPLHTVYGGAHLFKAGTPRKLGELALRLLSEYAPDPRTFADAVGMGGGAALHEAVYARVLAKLAREPVEDYRIDFEDGFGPRPEAEEDAEAERTALEVARALGEGTLPPFFGIRVKSLGEEHKARALRTLDRFVTTLAGATGGALPPGFVVTLPKVTSTAQVRALARALEALEASNRLLPGSLRLELMVELVDTLVDAKGRLSLPRLARAAGGRCVAAHLGSYDHTASCGITAAHQHGRQPSCELARQLMLLAFAGTGVRLSDGATNVLPIPPHRGGSLRPDELEENRRVVHDALRLHHGNVRLALEGGFYQGWDLHPGQLPVRYAASFAFFLEALEPAALRLAAFLDNAARATRVGATFDDAATGQGLVNFFLRAEAAGALEPRELARSGLTADELRLRSFAAIVATRTAPRP